jgi:NAD(P)-dependent dehydrogenase (short-subunit alcohol dehydrogenase family)
MLVEVFLTNVLAPLAVIQELRAELKPGARIINVTSDAAVTAYPGWGGYGASKAALDHLTLTFGAENLDITCYALDPGDMRTDMQQAAFPGEDISDRRSPNEVVPALVDLITTRPPSGRYRAGDRVALPDAVQKGNPVQDGSPAVAAS